MFLITSGAYIEQEFISEFGLIPPSFLPIGNRCLFEHQIPLAKMNSDKIFMSIPESFKINEQELEIIEDNGVKLISIPDGYTLGESILYCLKTIDFIDEPLQIIHGDTLLDKLPKGYDLITISQNTGYYPRAMLSNESEEDLLESRIAVDDEFVVNGYFSFADANKFKKIIESNKSDFILAINKYNIENPIEIIKTENWYDFGHINAYFNSRASFTTERSFNELKISEGKVIKSSNFAKKIEGESNWFKNIPASLKIYTPKFIDEKKYKLGDNNENSYYSLEYLYNLPLSDLFVFGRLENESWNSILKSCKEFLDKCAQIDPKTIEHALPSESYNNIYLTKTIKRLEQYSKMTGDKVDRDTIINNTTYPSLIEVANISAKYIPTTNQNDIRLIHGDFCFSNILYDFRARRIKVIDPRGIDYNENKTVLGDQRYDLAKLYHSAVGYYDHIIAGRIKALENNNNLLSINKLSNKLNIEQIFENIFFKDSPESKQTTLAITIHLFLSMLPLHNDKPERQNIMIVNAIRLYNKLLRQI